jgi:hypothetical protein
VCIVLDDDGTKVGRMYIGRQRHSEQGLAVCILTIVLGDDGTMVGRMCIANSVGRRWNKGWHYIEDRVERQWNKGWPYVYWTAVSGVGRRLCQSEQELAVCVLSDDSVIRNNG